MDFYAKGLRTTFKETVDQEFTAALNAIPKAIGKSEPRNKKAWMRFHKRLERALRDPCIYSVPLMSRKGFRSSFLTLGTIEDSIAINIVDAFAGAPDDLVLDCAPFSGPSNSYISPGVTLRPLVMISDHALDQFFSRCKHDISALKENILDASIWAGITILAINPVAETHVAIGMPSRDGFWFGRLRRVQDKEDVTLKILDIRTFVEKGMFNQEQDKLYNQFEELGNIGDNTPEILIAITTSNILLMAAYGMVSVSHPIFTEDPIVLQRMIDIYEDHPFENRRGDRVQDEFQLWYDTIPIIPDDRVLTKTVYHSRNTQFVTERDIQSGMTDFRLPYRPLSI